ncbi:hypothetical protein [Saccharothrix coeruleofusca]|nr:hypothetical protein [Saccharothrix coeruleofusca]
MAGDDLELLITLVVAADDERQALTACAGLLRRVGGSVLQARDCSDEEPGCWSVTISRTSGEPTTGDAARHSAGALAMAVRGFVRALGDDFPLPRIACDPPAAWAVIEDPALLDGLVPGAERLLVEAWAGGDPYRRDAGAAPEPEPEPEPTPEPTPDPAPDPPQAPEPVPEPEPEPGPEPALTPDPDSTVRLLLRVDVAADRPAGAEWQARAVASRVGRDGKITRVAPLGHLLSVHFDLGTSVGSTTSVLLDAVSSLGRSGWSAPEWSGESATVRWSATPPPITGVTALELNATPTSALVWTEPE